MSLAVRHSLELILTLAGLAALNSNSAVPLCTVELNLTVMPQLTLPEFIAKRATLRGTEDVKHRVEG